MLNNRYEILEQLGRGGFGETFLAIDTRMPSRRKCVIKQLKPDDTTNTAPTPGWFEKRFQREAAILEKLGRNHPQIPQLYEYFSEGENFFFVQEWIEGITLSQKHQREGNLSEAEVEKILGELLPVLDYIHGQGIIHRDIKPDNIILRASDGKPVLIDFGIVKEVNNINVGSKTVSLGTPGYMAPEQIAGHPVFSSDLYSLGLTAIFLLTGKTPQALTSDPNTGEILWRKDAPGLHSNLAAVIDRAVRFHPRDRFTSAQEMWFFGLCYAMDWGYKGWNPYVERHLAIFVNCFLSRANSSIKSLAREGFSQFMPPYRTITSNEEPVSSRAK